MEVLFLETNKLYLEGNMYNERTTLGTNFCPLIIITNIYQTYEFQFPGFIIVI